MQKFKSLLSLFFSMVKIGLFTFGGGYAMIPFFENEFVNKKKFMNKDEFMDLITIAESTPGPISINCSTFIGFKILGFWGALIATIGVCLPSFLLVYIISLFFAKFLEITWVSAAFKGIQICVVFLIFSAGFKLFKQIHKTPLTLSLFIITYGCMVTFGLLSIKFSSIYYILIVLVGSIIVHLINCLTHKKNKNVDKEDNKWFSLNYFYHF